MKKAWIFLAAIAMSLLLTGCFVKTADELYALPEQPDDYYSLHSAINEIMTADAQFSSPISGSYQQPVQMSDLTGNGVDEAIVFVKTTGKKPLKTYIFERIDDTYQNTCVIEGDGNAFARVEYAQIDGEGGVEIVICRQVSNEVPQAINVYRLADGQPNELLNANYSEFSLTDLDGDGKRDLFLLRYDTEDAKGTAELYSCRADALERVGEANISADVSTVNHVTSGNLTPSQKAVFVGGTTEDGTIVTDVFMVHNGSFEAKSSLTDLGLQSAAVRGYNVFASDVDGDGNTELPDVVRLTPQNPEETEDLFSAIRWFSYDPDVGLRRKYTTYHNYTSGWYLTMPESIGTNFAVKRGNDVAGFHGIIFCSESSGIIGGELFTLYAFTGNHRNSLAEQDGRFILGTKNEITFAAILGPEAQNYGITQETLTEMFDFIRVDWNSGET